MEKTEKTSESEKKKDLLKKAEKNYNTFKKFILVLALVNLAIFIGFMVVSLTVIDLTVCENQLFDDGVYKILDRQYGRLIHNLITGDAHVYEQSRFDREPMLSMKLGLRMDLNNYQRIAFHKSLQTNDTYEVHYWAKATIGYDVELSVSDSVLDFKQNTTGVYCRTFEWKLLDFNLTRGHRELEDCIWLNGSSWYGQAESKFQQYWPINKYTTPNEAYVPYVSGLFEDGASVIERFWLSNAGVAVIVDSRVPLFVKKNANQLCLLAQANQPPYSNIPQTESFLKYDICQIDKKADPLTYLNKLHGHVINNYFARPTGLPDDSMLSFPIWSTWAKYKKRINESQMMEFAQEIYDYAGSSVAQLEIDDKWEPEYGDLTVDTVKFPDLARLVQDIKSTYGYETTLWIHPFTNADNTDDFMDQISKGHAVKTVDNIRPAITQWWNGKFSTIFDAKNDESAESFYSRLKYLQDTYGIASFKFDAGEIFWLPKAFSMNIATPDEYTELYARLTARFGNRIEVRVGSHTQDLPIFVRMLDKDSTWTIEENGLESLVTTALTMSFLGYSYILPDMIGGNAYSYNGTDIDFDADTIVLPEKELYLRWAQVSAFLPSMQFSLSPWQYDDETIRTECLNLIKLHHEKVYPVLVKYAEETMQSGVPLIRPVWWLDNSNTDSYSVQDQFLVGDELLVAPILKAKQYSRIVFFPRGNWTDGQKTYRGASYLNYDAPLNVIPHFWRV